MSNGGDTERKSHIKRIYKNDDPSSAQWIDIERLDELTFRQGRAEQFRLKRWKFDWDDFNPDGPNVTKKKIVNPTDEDTFIEVPIRDSYFVREGRAEQYQGNKYKLTNDETNKTRETHSRRVYHHEMKKDYLIAGEPPSDPQQYLDALGDQDKDQYVEVEILDRYWTKEKESKDSQGRIKPSTWQQKKWRLSEVDPLLQEPMVEGDEDEPDFVPVHNPQDGPKVDPPWRLDPLQNIVNVQWGGGNVIVVFVDGSPEASQVASSYAAIEDKADLLSTFQTPYSADGFMPGLVSSAFKVARDAGNFITSTAPTLTGDQPLGYTLIVCVFAIEGDLDSSLERAVAGTKLIIPALELLSSSTGTSDLPTDLFPPGLLWLVQTGMMNGGQALTWKMRHGRHRKSTEEGGEPSDLPNNMTQCYHLTGYTGPSGGVELITWSGYRIYGYRLDKNGTDTVYGKVVWTPGINDQNIASEWKQLITDPGDSTGIPIADPPPLVTSDLTTS